MGENQIHEGEVQEFGTSPSGSTKIKIAGQWFYSGNVDTAGIAFGDRVSIEWKEFSPPPRAGHRGPPVRLKMIQSWGKLPALAPQTSQGLQRVNPNAATMATQMGQQEPTRAQLQGPSVMDADYIRLISNVLAALATSGKIETPNDIRLWYAALHGAVMGVGEMGPTEDFDDKIPY
jgi:hypothetical protein